MTLIKLCKLHFKGKNMIFFVFYYKMIIFLYQLTQSGLLFCIMASSAVVQSHFNFSSLLLGYLENKGQLEANEVMINHNTLQLEEHVHGGKNLLKQACKDKLSKKKCEKLKKKKKGKGCKKQSTQKKCKETCGLCENDGGGMIKVCKKSILLSKLHKILKKQFAISKQGKLGKSCIPF